MAKRILKLKAKLYNEEGASMAVDSPNDKVGRTTFLHLMFVGLESYGLKDKKQTWDQAARKAKRDYNKLQKLEKEKS